ncbi:MAG TPA: hypothetical protein PLS93_17500 [Accumulibacter sp.]|nr:hypothetical protein [Accumulibacter sp.]
MKRTTLFALALAALLATTAPISFAQETDPKARLQTAEKMFAERCKKSGEFIHRTAENVEGVFLMKIRPKGMNYEDQFRMDDPYGRDLGGDGYVLTFVRGSYQAQTKGMPYPGSPQRIGYPYVEAIDPADGKRYRYRGIIKEVTKTSSPLVGGDGSTFKVKEFTLDRVPATGPQPRYGVTYDDISTGEERDYWIAGSSLKVIDLKTNEVMAERIGYMMDRGQGNKSGGRSPWLLAADNACPRFAPRHASTAQPYQALDFVEKVLKHSKEK